MAAFFSNPRGDLRLMREIVELLGAIKKHKREVRASRAQTSSAQPAHNPCPLTTPAPTLRLGRCAPPRG